MFSPINTKFGGGDTFVGRGPREIALVEEDCRSASNFCRARESSESKSTDVEEETLRASFLTFGAASSGSGRCRPAGIRHKTHTETRTTDLRHTRPIRSTPYKKSPVSKL